MMNYHQGWTRSPMHTRRRAGAHAGGEKPYFLYLIAHGGRSMDQGMVRGCLKAAGIPLSPCFDWCCVQNFQDETRPRVIPLPAGKGVGFSFEMARFIDAAAKRLRRSLASEAYRKKISGLMQYHEQQERDLAQSFSRSLKRHDLSVLMGDREHDISGREGEESARLFQSGVPAGWDHRPAGQAGESSCERVPEDFQAACERIREIKKRCSEDIERCTVHTSRKAIAPLATRLRKRYRRFPKILVYLQDVEEDILRNPTAFTLPAWTAVPFVPGRDSLNPCHDRLYSPYRVTVIAGGSDGKSCPVIFARNPDRERLMGCFPMDGKHGSPPSPVRGGLLHEANGGCLVIEASWIIRNIHLWELLKKTVMEQELAVTDTNVCVSMSASGNRASEAIPLHLAVVITGSLVEYSFLSFVDREFTGLVNEPWILSNGKPEQASPGDIPFEKTSPSCHMSACKAVLQLCAASGVPDDRFLEHLKTLMEVIRKARAYAGVQELTAGHISLALKNEHPGFSLGQDLGIPWKGQPPTGLNRYTVRSDTVMEPTKSYSGKVLIYGK